ncbi:MAG: zinc carboxypeptidase [Burkholderiaceae bacterium]|nr:zinc carboxypeptidase [Burkholderiaceae bacterium]
MSRALPAEIEALERLVEQLQAHAVVRCEATVHADEGAAPVPLPVYSIALGSTRDDAPAVGIFGGVHGLERIGTEVVLAFLAHLVARLAWDDSLHALLDRLRVVVMPLVNPGGLVRGTRANPAGVDLMRNAPVESAEPVHWLLGGQRMSARLPWYRGPAQAPLQPEAAALCAVVARELLPRPFALAIDCHSGFGLADRLWFPFAHTRTPIAQPADVHALKALFDASHPQHRYLIEPQSRQYCTHGDLWDHLLLRAGSGAAFVPLTLEMGSWTWVRKNPRQLFTRHGMFNPLIDHRRDRVLRRHMVWLDFALRAAASHARWRPVGAARDRRRAEALALWYGQALAEAR